MYTYSHVSDTLCVNPSGTPLDTLSPVEAGSYCGSMSTLKDILSDMKEAKTLVAAREHHGGSSATALQRQLGTSIASKIARLPALSPGDAAPLLEAVHSCGQSAPLSF